MASLELLVRAAVQTWAAGLAWQISPSVHVEEPEPGSKPQLPTLAAWFDKSSVKSMTAREVLPGVFYLGHAEERIAFIFRAGSSADAETYREDWRNVAITAAIDASTNGAPVVPLTLRIGDENFGGKLYLTAETELAGFEETQMRGLWELRCYGLLAFPSVAVRAPSALMSISLELDGDVYQASDFRVPLVLETLPEAGGEYSIADAVEILFDLPMDLASLQRAVDADDFTVIGLSDRRFSFLPRSEATGVETWANGTNTLSISALARSLAGTPMSPFTLPFTGV